MTRLFDKDLDMHPFRIVGSMAFAGELWRRHEETWMNGVPLRYGEGTEGLRGLAQAA